MSWITNKYEKPNNLKYRRKDGKVPILRKKCFCGRRIKNHHYLCDKCWNKKYKKVK